MSPTPLAEPVRDSTGSGTPCPGGIDPSARRTSVGVIDASIATRINGTAVLTSMRSVSPKLMNQTKISVVRSIDTSADTWSPGAGVSGTRKRISPFRRFRPSTRS
jgi:hypothetical protein